jgi:hypothetical protein
MIVSAKFPSVTLNRSPSSPRTGLALSTNCGRQRTTAEHQQEEVAGERFGPGEGQRRD